MNEQRSHHIVVPERGGPEVMRLVAQAVPEPAVGEVLVKVAASGVSAFDLMTRSTWFPGNPKPPFTPGEDIVGVVDAVGEDVDVLQIGQRVAGWTYGDGGGYAEHICRPADLLVPEPDGLDDAEAVAMVINFLTAHLYLHKTAEVRAGERVLVHGAAGGLGSALVQLGGLAGLELYGTASAHNQDAVAGLGATPIDYRNEDFVARVRELTGDGADVVFDTVGGVGQLWRSYRAVRRGGRLVPIGSAAVSRNGASVIPLSLLMTGALKLYPGGKGVPLSPNMMRYPVAHPDWYRDTLAALLDLAATGAVKPIVADRIPLSEAARAHELLANGRRAGKVVLVSD